MMTAKEKALDLISRLPDDTTWQDIMYRLHVSRKIEEGRQAADQGCTIPHDEVKRLFARNDV